MKKILTSLAALALLAFAAGTAYAAGPYDAVYDCHVVMPIPNPGTTFDIYMLFLSKPDGTAGFAGLTIPNTGVFQGYSLGHLNGNVFTISGNSTSLTFSAPQNGPITISGTWAVLGTPATSFNCTQVF